MISQATIAKYLGSELISTPLGKYSRTIRLRFSLLPRSHGECGWAKYTTSSYIDSDLRNWLRACALIWPFVIELFP